MVWVTRDDAGKISGVLANRSAGFADEELPDDDPVVVAYLNPPPISPLDRWDVILLRMSFNHENRIRVLEGKAAITAAQFKTVIRAL